MCTTRLSSVRASLPHTGIDTTCKKVNDDEFGHVWVRRTKRSKWSTNTQSYAKRLIKDGRMQPEGQKWYEEGLKKPAFDSNRLKEDLALSVAAPKDLLLHLAKDEDAHEFFLKLAPSYKRNYLRWIVAAKKKDTRARRIARTIDNMKAGKKTLYA
eukprot:TRINITY_DN873_c0_g1_i1.p1 TRINITY_DN873_c0_g1~~TRINITY_DN873_c0_g1_i1.p1  ORF type:complete len:155 (-),score=23.68 TRINITY_DN873_c0_g1_i1:142-606(-)